MNGRERIRVGLIALYLGTAVLMIPWILLLYHLQAPKGISVRLHLVGSVVSTMVIVGAIRTAVACRRNNHIAVPVGAGTATIAFLTAWFSTVSSVGEHFALALTYAVVVQVPVTVICLWIMWRLFRPHGEHSAPPSLAPKLLLVAVAALIPLVVILGRETPLPHTDYHLRLVWIGLDCFEVLGLAMTGIALIRRSPTLAVYGSVTAMLLFADAWFNIVPTTGDVQHQGILMGLVEVPLGALSFALARREVRSWPEASPRRRRRFADSG